MQVVAGVEIQVQMFEQLRMEKEYGEDDDRESGAALVPSCLRHLAPLRRLIGFPLSPIWLVSRLYVVRDSMAGFANSNREAVSEAQTSSSVRVGRID